MKKQKLQCLIVGESTNFTQLLEGLASLGISIQLTYVANDNNHIEAALKAKNNLSIIFVSDDAKPLLKFISDLTRQYTPSTIVVIVTKKTASIPFKRLFKGVDFAKLNVKSSDAVRALHLQNIVKVAERNQLFKQCKRLLVTAEQRNMWLLDSSAEAIAYISTDSHAYANTAYLALFGIDSLQILKKVRPADLIVKDESGIFGAFLKYQAKHHMLSHTLLLSMKGLKQSAFRASVHAIPSVYKGKKCWQLWVHKINRTVTESDRRKDLRKERFQLPSVKVASSRENPFDDLNKEIINKKKKADIELIMKGIIKRQEVGLSAQKLVSLASQLNKVDIYPAHYMLTLKVPVAQKKGVDDLLFSSPKNNENGKRKIFWDKVKVARLIQLLSRKKGQKNNYFITLESASIANSNFTRWMLQSLKTLGVRSKNLTIMIPSELQVEDLKTTLEFVRALKKLKCNIALNDFTVKSNVIKIIRFLKPEFIRLSLDWVKEIESDERRKNALSILLRQLEVKSIQVIAPCDFSAEMKKMFIFSGVSFCQERTTKSA